MYRWARLASPGTSTTGRFGSVHVERQVVELPAGEHWRVSMEGMDRLAELGRLDGSEKGDWLHWKLYEDEVRPSYQQCLAQTHGLLPTSVTWCRPPTA